MGGMGCIYRMDLHITLNAVTVDFIHLLIGQHVAGFRYSGDIGVLCGGGSLTVPFFSESCYFGLECGAAGDPPRCDFGSATVSLRIF